MNQTIQSRIPRKSECLLDVHEAFPNYDSAGRRDQYQESVNPKRVYHDLDSIDEIAHENLDDLFGSETETDNSGEIMSVEYAHSDGKVKEINLPKTEIKDKALKEHARLDSK
jgi:hypothetical protein